MNTDQLVDVLSANLEPARGTRFGRTLALAMIAGGAGALGLMLATVGPRPELGSPAHLEWMALKLFFALSVTGSGAPFLLRLIRPGHEYGNNWLLVFLPFLAIVAAALVTLFLAPTQVWKEMILGATTLSPARCFFCTGFFATIPLAILIWGLREGAPTRLKLTGAIAGIVAGGLGAAAYALSCNSDAILFIAIWYSSAIMFCALIGAQLGPRLLRW